MKIISLLFIAFLQTDCTAWVKATESKPKEEVVYVCGSGKGTRYHLKEHCRGLNNCSTRTLKTTLKEATKEGKTLCGWEK